MTRRFGGKWDRRYTDGGDPERPTMTQQRVKVADDPTAAWKEAQRLVRDNVPPGVSLVDELIADRRREALLEAQRMVTERIGTGASLVDELIADRRREAELD
jgi:hypothetical protein